MSPGTLELLGAQSLKAEIFELEGRDYRLVLDSCVPVGQVVLSEFDGEEDAVFDIPAVN